MNRKKIFDFIAEKNPKYDLNLKNLIRTVTSH